MKCLERESVLRHVVPASLPEDAPTEPAMPRCGAAAALEGTTLYLLPSLAPFPLSLTPTIQDNISPK